MAVVPEAYQVIRAFLIRVAVSLPFTAWAVSGAEVPVVER